LTLPKNDDKIYLYRTRVNRKEVKSMGDKNPKKAPKKKGNEKSSAQASAAPSTAKKK
jgi:hypothetical protein